MACLTFDSKPSPMAFLHQISIPPKTSLLFLNPLWPTSWLHFLDLIVKLNSATSDNPPVTCIVSDGTMPFTSTAAQEFKIPVVMFFPLSACSVMGVLQLPSLKDKGIIPLKGITTSAKSNWNLAFFYCNWSLYAENFLSLQMRAIWQMGILTQL